MWGLSEAPVINVYKAVNNLTTMLIVVISGSTEHIFW